MMYNKYGNRKTNGFDSVKEFKRYQELQLLERAGKISGLTKQVAFELIPKQYDDNGKFLFHGITYIADFAYWKDGRYIVEDCKGFKTKEYMIKKKLLYYFRHIKIKET